MLTDFVLEIFCSLRAQLSGYGDFSPKSAVAGTTRLADIVPHFQTGELISIPYEQGEAPPCYTGYLLYMKRNRNELSDLIRRIESHIATLSNSRLAEKD